MATEEIIIRYKADVSQLETDINKAIDSQDDLVKATQANTKAQQTATAETQKSSKARIQAYEKEAMAAKKAGQNIDNAFDGKNQDKFNKELDKTNEKLKKTGDTADKAGDKVEKTNAGIGNSLKSIAGAFGLAFGIESVINFGKAAVNAFMQAEDEARKLKIAVLNVAGESEEALARLNEQQQQLSETSTFSAGDLATAQAQLLAFDLTAKEIEGLLPLLLEYAAQGRDLNQVVSQIGSAVEGSAGAFAKQGLELDKGATKAENLQKVVELLSRSQGAVAEEVETTSGKFKIFQKAIGDFTESVGAGIVTFVRDYIAIVKDVFSPLIDSFQRLKNVIIDLIPDSIINKLKEFFSQGEGLKNTLNALSIFARGAAIAVSFLYDAIVQVVAGVSGLVNVFREGFNEIGKSASQLGEGISNIFKGITKFDPSLISKGVDNIKGGFTKAGVDLAKAFNEGYNNTLKIANADKISEDAEKAKLALAEAGDVEDKRLIKTIDLRGKNIDQLKKLAAEQDKTNVIGRRNLETINLEITKREEAADKAKKAGEAAKNALTEYLKLLENLDAEILKIRNELEKRKIEIINPKSQQEQIDKVKALADLNEKAIDDEIALKIKAVQEDKKLSDKQKEEVIKKYGELKQARLDLAQFNEQNELNIISAEQVKRIEDAAKQLDDLNIEQALVIEADKVEAANEAVAQSFEDLGEAVSKADFEAAKEAATARTAALNQSLTDELNINKTRIENAREAELAKVKEGEAAEAERAAINQKYDNQILNQTKSTNDQIAENNKNLNDQIETQEAASFERRTEQTFQYLDATAQVISEISNLFSEFTNQRISEIEEIKEAELKAIDEQEQRIEEDLEFRRITDEQAKLQKEELERAKVRAEEDAAKKIRELKKKQAILDKTSALFQIAINTAKNITEQPGPFGSLVGLWIALGLAQAGVVLAQPIPYRKGSKDTGDQGHMARVGEEGEEFVWMPANSKVLPARQTKKYSDVIDAMYDNKLDDYIYKHYITPQLIAQKQAKESQQSKSFAQNMADSIVYNQSGLTASDLERQRRKGQYINNVDELANAIAKKLPSFDPYRN